LQRYARILRVPRVAALLAATLVVRLPLGINSLAVLLFVRQETGSFALAGAAAGGLSLGFAVGVPLQGRTVDRFGLKTLLPAAFGHAFALALLIALGEADASGAALVATAFLTGVSFPPAAVVLRALWPTLLRDEPDLVPAAYALDSVVVQTLFVIGPLLTAALVALISPVAALATAAVCMVVGTVAFLAARPPQPEHRPAEARGRDWLGALRSPGIRTVVLATLPIGIGMGAIQVGIPAFADEEAHPELAGVLLATWSATSAVGGLIFGTLARRGTLTSIHLKVTALIPLTFVPPVLATSPALMVLLIIPAGSLIAPFIATRNEIAERVAPEGTKTEALSWPITALTAGISGGAAIAGLLAEDPGWRAALASAVVAAAIGALVVALRRGTLKPRAPAFASSTSR
jgi:predicted MFS family arabinose efflux permease